MPVTNQSFEFRVFGLGCRVWFGTHTELLCTAPKLTKSAMEEEAEIIAAASALGNELLQDGPSYIQPPPR